MEQEWKELLVTLEDAGCEGDELAMARRLYAAGDPDALLRCLRRFRCNRMEELHRSQRKVDCLDHLIRQTMKEEKGTRK